MAADGTNPPIAKEAKFDITLICTKSMISIIFKLLVKNFESKTIKY